MKGFQPGSETFLDDVLQRLAPSLSRHTGGTIIDINPGVGLFSSKLHDVVKPKRHILVEPAQSAYLPFLQPLLDAPESRYRLRNWDYDHQIRPDKYLAEGLLPEFKKAKTADGRNDSILLVANMSPTKSSGHNATLAIPSIFQYLIQVRHKISFQANGTVRMLLWMNDSEKTSVLPRTVHPHRKIAVELDMTCYVEEIAGAGLNHNRDCRDSFLDVESSRRVAREMKRQGIQIPYDRLGEIPRNLSVDDFPSLNESMKDSVTMPTFDTQRTWHKELEKLQQRFRDGEFFQFKNCTSKEAKGVRVRRSTKSGDEHTPQYFRLHQLESALKNENAERLSLEPFLQEEDLICSLEYDLQDQTLESLQKEAKLKELQQRRLNLKIRLDEKRKKFVDRFFFITDNKKACTQDPPLLMWDRRTAEPLIAEKQEFYRENTLALLDLQPRTPNPFPMNIAQAIIFGQLMSTLYANGLNTLKVLDSVVPGASQAIAPNVPALTNIRRGGRHHLSDLRVRCFTPEMCYSILQAWEKWPFKSSLIDLHFSIRKPGFDY